MVKLPERRSEGGRGVRLWPGTFYSGGEGWSRFFRVRDLPAWKRLKTVNLIPIVREANRKRAEAGKEGRKQFRPLN